MERKNVKKSLREKVFREFQGLRPEQVLDELARRFGVSGVEEKASRPHKK